MHETPPALFEALLLVSDAVLKQSEEARLSAIALRGALRSGVARSPLVDRERRNQLLEADARAAALSEVWQELEELLSTFRLSGELENVPYIRGLSTVPVDGDA